MPRTESPRPSRVGDLSKSWRAFYSVCALVGLLALIAVVATIWRQADNALADIQQEDPRLHPTSNLVRLPTVTPKVAGAADSIRPTLIPTSALATPEAVSLPDTLSQPLNVLLIGVDKRPDDLEGVRSDTLILVRIDPQQHWASMLSIPRDSVVQVPNLGWAKMNAAYAYGYNNAEAIYGTGTDKDAAGGALAAETIEQFLNIKIDYTAQVDFHGFEQLVDTLGGLVIDVQTPLLDGQYPTENYGYQRIYIPAGLQTLNGQMALIYARTRHASSDFDRSKRQQQVLRTVLEQVRARKLLDNAALLPQWATVLRQNIRTTLPIRDFAFLNGLALLARDLRSDRILQLSINPNDVAIDREDGSDIYWNRADIAALVERWQQGPQP